MNISRHGYRFAAQFFRAALIAVLMTAVLAACGSENEPPEPSLEPTAEATELLFEAGKYVRDDYCGRVFEYHQTSYGALTVAIADNLIEVREPQELAEEVIALYKQLSASSPMPMAQPLTVYIISDPMMGGCSSQGDRVFVDSAMLDSPDFRGELLGAGTGIGEYWVQMGLASLAMSEQPDLETLQDWYQNTDDLDMAGLFYARFVQDWASEEEIEIARQSATSLVQYALEVENIPADELETQVNNEVRTRWLASLGVDRVVTYPHDGRFAGFTYAQNNDCMLIVRTDNILFCLNRLPEEQEYFDEIPEVALLIDRATYGRRALVEYLTANAPSVGQLTNPNEPITITVKELRAFSGYTDGKSVYLQNHAVYYFPLHEIVHTFDWNTALDQTWMKEGFAQYLGVYLPIVPQPEKTCIFKEINGELFNNGLTFTGEDTIIPAGTSSCYFLDLEQFAAAKAWYLAQGGQMETEDEIDPRLYADAVSFATIYRNAYHGVRGVLIGYKYGYYDQNTNPDVNDLDGLELNYTQAASFVAYLCDTYTLDRVLDVYVNGAEDGLLDGKTYVELKDEWQAYLMEKGAGIAIPGQP